MSSDVTFTRLVPGLLAASLCLSCGTRHAQAGGPVYPRTPSATVAAGSSPRNGQASLSGAVATLPQKMAGEDAVNAAGTWLVENRLQARPGVPYTDAQLKAAVEQRLRQHPYTASAVETLRVDVTKGAVMLSGRVDSPFQGYEVARVVSFVPGVVSVKDDTRSESNTVNQRNDADILRDLERELRWDPRVEASELSVAVHDAVVTVAGTVANWDTRNAVLEDVYQMLPRAFDDQVRLRPHARLRYAP